MKERPFQKRIEDMLDVFGWDWWHVPSPVQYEPGTRRMVPARRAAGLCDIIAMHDDPPRLLFLEVKGDKGKLSDEQRRFLSAAKRVAEDEDGETACPPKIGVHAVWPKDEEAVERMLRTRNVR